MTVRRNATRPGGRQARLLPHTSPVSSWVLGAILLAGALVRFGTLGHQSLWFDEALTHNLVIQPFGHMLTIVADTENTPPLFYVLTSAVTDLVGTGEVGLRLVSALSGTATIGVAFLGGRELSGDRAGLVAAGLVATNPMLVWFSQEARSYALVILLTAIALICFLRVVRTGRGRALAGWVVASALALTTHYFAIFPVAAEAGWLVWAAHRRPAARRRLLAAVGGVAMVAAAIAPLALSQQSHGSAKAIAHEALGQRIAQVPKQLLVGYDAPVEVPLALLSAALLLLGAVGLWRLRGRTLVRATLLVALAAVGVPVLVAVGGLDFLNTRNVLPGLVPVLILAGAGFTAARPGVTAAGGVLVLGLVAVVGVNRNPVYERTDWRAVNDALGHSDRPRVLVVSPAEAVVPLRAYGYRAAPARDGGPAVRELVVLGVAVKGPAGVAPEPPRPASPPAPPPGFKLVATRTSATYTLFRYRSPAPRFLAPARLGHSRLTVDYAPLLLAAQPSG